MTKSGSEMPNGRDVSLKTFRLESAYTGVLEGAPESAGERTLKQVRKLVEKNATGARPIVLICALSMNCPSSATLPVPCWNGCVRKFAST